MGWRAIRTRIRKTWFLSASPTRCGGGENLRGVSDANIAESKLRLELLAQHDEGVFARVHVVWLLGG